MIAQYIPTSVLAFFMFIIIILQMAQTSRQLQIRG
jgi:hypothetical protein